MNTLEAIYNRRSCRNYTEEPVLDKIKDKMLFARLMHIRRLWSAEI